ncbi:MAG: hypothetical protein KDD41_11485 [Flavobacteriales bacterium]|nr:hypothetical protein [Flavobacteriales bacterium]
MSNGFLITTAILILSYIIGKYQQSQGYSFSKSFIGALIGLTGLALLAYKAFS